MAETPFLSINRTTGSSRILSITTRLGVWPTIFIACLVLSMLSGSIAYLGHAISGQPMGWTGIANTTLIPFLLGGPTLYVLLTLVHRLEATRAELASLSSIDVLTGTMNRRSILEYAEHQLCQVAAQARSGGNGRMAIALMDVDHFKRINDQFGHLAGDAVLRQLVTVARQALPENCALGRFGGEEFAIVMQGRDLDTAVALAETVRAAIENQACEHRGQAIHLTVSLGVHSSQHDSLEEMLFKADRALYSAKDNGRNRVESLAQAKDSSASGVNVVSI